MKKNEALYHLIKSLNKTEKRYITLQISSQKSTPPIYLKLFYLLDKMKSYSEQGLKKEYDKLNENTPLARVKRYLYHQLKKILLAYQMDNSIYGKILIELHAVEFFYNKNLYDLSWDAVVKAKKLAIDSEKNEILIDILRWERVLLAFQAPKEKEATQKEYKRTIAKVNNEYDTFVLSDQVYDIITSGEASKVRIEKLQKAKLLDDPLLKDINLAQSVRAKLHFHNAYFFYHQTLGNYALCCQATKNNIALLENSPKYTYHNPRSYLNSLINLIVSQLELNNPEETTKTLNKLKQLEKTAPYNKSKHILAIINAYYYELSNILYVYNGHFKEAKAIRNISEKTLDTYKEYIKPYQKMYFQQILALGCFGSDDFKEALNWTNKMLNEKSAFVGGVKSQFYMLNIIIHFELGNIDYLPHCIKIAQQYLKKTNTISKSDLLLLKHLNKIKKTATKEEIKKFFQKLLFEIEPLTKNPQENFSYRNYEFTISWLIAKRDNRKFEHVFRERIAENPIHADR
ncbi:MAG: hypothetical protein J5I47_06895 [Vicingus serpentipes]|nr:hypothetical protein [Vicingus serpentipes]